MPAHYPGLPGRFRPVFPVRPGTLPAADRGASIRSIRAILVLVTGAAVVFGGVLWLAALTVGESPPATVAAPGDPDDGPDASPGSGEEEEPGPEPSVPAGEITGLAGALEVTGDRSGLFELTHQSTTGDSFGLEGDDGRVVFDRDEAGDLFIDQMSWDGLEFFLDPGDCVFETEGTLDELGLAIVHLTCPDIRDIRDTATVDMEGRAGLPIDLVVEREVPDLGGTLEVTGDVQATWPVEVAVWGPGFAPGQSRLTIIGPSAVLTFGAEGEPVLQTIEVRGTTHTISTGSCDTTVVQVAAVDPGTTLDEVTIDCEGVGMGDDVVAIAGTVVVSHQH
jgi:hypothetical protein